MRTAIVTGGGQGIGRATVEALLADGWAVVLAEHDSEAGEETAAELASRGQVLFVQTDVSDEASVAAMVAMTTARFGRLDGLVCNAGFSRNKPVEELSLEDWNAVIGTNLTGTFLCAKHAAPHLRPVPRETGGGAIVTIASTRASMSEANTEAYSASKGGIVALTHALAVSLGPDVRVNCVSPGWIDTTAWKKRSRRASADLSPEDHAQHPVGRVGRPEDIAEAVRWLLSPAAGFTTGVELKIDGGMTRKMIYAE